MFGRKKKASEVDRLKRWYSEELKRKDGLIKDLREKNLLLMKSALKQAEKREELDQMVEKLKHKQNL